MRITTKFSLALAAASLALVVGFGFYESRRNSVELLNVDLSFHRMIVGNLITPLGRALWEINNESITALILPVFSDEDTMKIFVYDAEGTLFFGATRDKAAGDIRIHNPKEVTSAENPKGLSPMKPVLPFSDTSLQMVLPPENIDGGTRLVAAVWRKSAPEDPPSWMGTLVLEWTQKSLERKLAEARLRTLMVSVVLVSMNVALQMVLLRVQVLKPLLQVSEALHRFSRGESVKLDMSDSNFEMIKLSDSFNDMVEKVSEVSENLRLLSRESRFVLAQTRMEGLVDQVLSSIQVLTRMNLRSEFWIAGDVLDPNGDPTLWYNWGEKEEESIPKDIHDLEEGIENECFRVTHQNTMKIMGIIVVKGAHLHQEKPHVIPLLDSLCPSVAAALLMIRVLEGHGPLVKHRRHAT